MQFHTTHRDGPARIGELAIHETTVTTPNILFLQTSRCTAPTFADLLLTSDGKKHEKPVFQIGHSVFSRETKKQRKDFAVDNYLIYPKDVLKELHLEALVINKKNSEFCIIPAQKEIIPEATKNNDATVFILASAAQLFSSQTAFVDFIVDLREQAGYQKLIYLPCIGNPTSISLLTYMGVDLFDSFSAFMAARNQTLLFPTGAYKKNELRELPCSCPACSPLKNNAVDMTFTQILLHNYYALINEIKHVRNAIAAGSLRELVETRVRADPGLSAMLRLLDMNHYQFLEERTPITRKSQLLATTKESLTRPEIRRFQDRVIQRYKKPESTKVLLLLPCSAKKPYSFSPSHKLFRDQLFNLENPTVIHELIVTSPIGIVPRELELTYPASSYDIAVTGHWDEDEKKMIRSLLQQYLKKNRYDTVVIHLPASLQEFISDVASNSVSTCRDSPTSERSLDELTEVLSKVIHAYDKVEPRKRTVENMTALASYQFGEHLAEQLLDGCTIQGKYPYQKIIHKNVQLGMVTEERGLISLTIDGANRLVSTENYWVDIDDDFILKGSVFAPGVKDADSSIRIGDEVIIRKNKNLCGVGVALMNGQEMNQSTYGEAVKVRHHVSK